MSKSKSIKNVFVPGPISPAFIGESIAKHQTKHVIGAHDIFLGQVRADEKEDSVVVAIDYSAYEDMANIEFHKIREVCFDQFEITCMHIYHSKGIVRAGEICLFVFVSAPRRKTVFKAIEFLVEEIKVKIPIFGKELMENQEHSWKVNTP